MLASEERQKLTEGQKAIDEVVFPLFLRLFELENEKKEIFDAILSIVKRNYPKTSLEIIDVLKKKLETGKCLLFLDSLDGVPVEHQTTYQKSSLVLRETIIAASFVHLELSGISTISFMVLKK